MTRVDFYLTGDTRPHAAMRLACRVSEKAWRLGNRVYLHVASPADAQRLDELMWTFRDVAFVPHELADTGAGDPPPVIIGHGEPPADQHDLLVNLTDAVPGFFARFERVAEVIGAGDTERAQGRARWKHYRERGYELESHEV